MDKFISIPVTAGDSFLLKIQKTEGECHVLVDGGMGTVSDPSITGSIGFDLYLLKKMVNCLDVIIVTHNDADHADGIIKVLKNKGISVGEVWLPAIWLDRLDDLIKDPAKFFNELLKELSERNPSLDGDEDLYEGNGFSEGIEVEIDDFLDGFSQSSSNWLLKKGKFYSVLKLMMVSQLGTHGFDLFKDALKIKAIFELAKSHPSKPAIRWFDFDIRDLQQNLKSVNPIAGPVQPVNSRYIKKVRINKHSALRYLYLSRSNRRSLVFYYPNCSLLFSADSDLSFSIPLLLSDAIVTAPHHGVESAASAYFKISSVKQVNLVRNSGVGRASKPGSTYISLLENKYCDRCNTGAGYQLVEFCSNSMGWRIQQGKRCTCI